MMYFSRCNECKKQAYSFSTAQLQRRAEEHMMETGHTVEISEE